MVFGKDALEVKLIEDACSKAWELGQAPGASVIMYEETFKLGRFFRAFTSKGAFNGALGKTNHLEIKLVQPVLPSLESGKAYLLSDLSVP